MESCRSLSVLKRATAEVVIPGPHPGFMGKSRRRSGARVKRGRPSWQLQAPAEQVGSAQQVSRLSAAQVLEQIERARLARDEADAELAALIDHAVGLSVGWPEIAARLGVTRQAVRQHYQRRHKTAPTARIAPPDQPPPRRLCKASAGTRKHLLSGTR